MAKSKKITKEQIKDSLKVRRVTNITIIFAIIMGTIGIGLTLSEYYFYNFDFPMVLMESDYDLIKRVGHSFVVMGFLSMMLVYSYAKKIAKKYDLND